LYVSSERLLRVRGDDPALARRHLLVGVEGEDRVHPVPADARAAVGRAERLARILDQREAVRRGDLAQRFELARVAEDVDGDDRARARRDGRLDRGRVEVERVGIDVGEHRRRALVDEAVGRRGERIGRGDALVTGADARDVAQQVQTGRAVGDGRRVRRADERGERLLELLDPRPERQPPRAQGLEDELLVALVQERAAELDAARLARAHAPAAVLDPYSSHCG
jgi:hypothetical protein